MLQAAADAGGECYRDEDAERESVIIVECGGLPLVLLVVFRVCDDVYQGQCRSCAARGHQSALCMMLL